MNARHTATVLFAALLGAGLATAADRPVDQSHPLAADGAVRVENVAGSVTVTGWDRAEVRITGTLGRGVRDLEVDLRDGRLVIEVEIEGRRDGHADLELMVPVGATVEVETVSADIEASGLSGELSLESVSGRVEVSGRPQRLEASSVSGDLRVAFAPDRSSLETVSGNLEVAEAAGRLDAESVSGAIRIGLGVVEDARLESVSGGIRFASELAPGGSVDIETMSGSVELTLAKALSAQVDLSTFSGSITSALGPAPKRSGGAGSGAELRFAAGSGAGRVTVSTFSGSITLKTR